MHGDWVTVAATGGGASAAPCGGAHGMWPCGPGAGEEDRRLCLIRTLAFSPSRRADCGLIKYQQQHNESYCPCYHHIPGNFHNLKCHLRRVAAHARHLEICRTMQLCQHLPCCRRRLPGSRWRGHLDVQAPPPSPAHILRAIPLERLPDGQIASSKRAIWCCGTLRTWWPWAHLQQSCVPYIRS